MHKYKVGRYYHKHEASALCRISIIAISAIPEMSDSSGPRGELSQEKSFYSFERQDSINLAHIVFATGSVFVGQAFEKVGIPELATSEACAGNSLIYISR